MPLLLFNIQGKQFHNVDHGSLQQGFIGDVEAADRDFVPDFNGNIALHLKFFVYVVLSNSDVIVGAFDQARQNSE